MPVVEPSSTPVATAGPVVNTAGIDSVVVGTTSKNTTDEKLAPENAGCGLAWGSMVPLSKSLYAGLRTLEIVSIH